MTQMQMNKLFNVDTRTLRNWKNGNRKELYNLLESLDLENAKKLLVQSDKTTYVKLLENENYYNSLLDFERELYPLLVNRDVNVWKKYANDTSISKEARLRSAYLYSYLSKKPLNLRFKADKLKGKVSFYYNNKVEDGDGFARYYGLKNCIDELRFKQYKNTGSF